MNHFGRKLPGRRIGIPFALTVCLLASLSCGKTGGTTLHIKSTATGEKDVPIKSGYAFAVTKSFTDTNGKVTTAVTYNAYTANYDLDAGNFAITLDKPMSSNQQVRVVFSLVGEEGTNEKSPLKMGTYSAKAGRYMKVENVGIVSRKGTVDSKNWLDRTALTGEVKVASVSDEEFSGDLDVASGDVSIKGSFSAKILKTK